ncbi:MAG TPA: hypothetical protein VFA43_21890 [Gemmatimonadaceae bacterium]|nr:hypothetical protein [Gemmatimonadaceae bacterium]
MRRFSFLVALLAFTALAGSAVAQDSTRRDTTRRDSTWQDSTHRWHHKRVRVTSPGEVDTAKIRNPSRRDSSLVRREMRVDTASAGKDTSARPTKPPPDTAHPKKPESPRSYRAASSL